MSENFSPECCGSGCAVCVLDYADDLAPSTGMTNLAGMLEAIEIADRLVSARCRPDGTDTGIDASTNTDSQQRRQRHGERSE
ncbi:MAG: hypothetical protein ACOYLF_06375 [Blastocatellia bacterium]|jgi:hypothetical protein